MLSGAPVLKDFADPKLRKPIVILNNSVFARNLVVHHEGVPVLGFWDEMKVIKAKCVVSAELAEMTICVPPKYDGGAAAKVNEKSDFDDVFIAWAPSCA